MRSAGFYLLQKGHKFAHEVAEDPSRQRVEGGGEGNAADQEDDVSSRQVCCREDKHHREGDVTAHVFCRFLRLTAMLSCDRAIILKGCSCWLRCKCNGAEY